LNRQLTQAVRRQLTPHKPPTRLAGRRRIKAGAAAADALGNQLIAFLQGWQAGGTGESI
jgi:hypothetical protein